MIVSIPTTTYVVALFVLTIDHVVEQPLVVSVVVRGALAPEPAAEAAALRLAAAVLGVVITSYYRL